MNSPHKGPWRGALMLYWICAWRNGWVHYIDAGDLRRHRAHYDIIAMHPCLNSNGGVAKHWMIWGIVFCALVSMSLPNEIIFQMLYCSINEIRLLFSCKFYKIFRSSFSAKSISNIITMFHFWIMYIIFANETLFHDLINMITIICKVLRKLSCWNCKPSK